ncbi:ATP-binding protein [Streptomyces sp. TG1A-8]|uniref:ATP-binding protein n=1 Tax=Streptomyces sp. TG1A-8 TaxID=3051385 RepID=UPI00265C4F4F|nr:ATP-binding protein [Streptomyces sp. TG1A-8]MDO0929337.1 ATP-binding protein [Streptomyces sp. TG1A-8]
MVIPLRNQAADEQGTEKHTALRYGAVWDSGAARAADARQALRAFLAYAPRTGRDPLPGPLALDAELAVSELVTNAVRHAPGPCGMTLRLSGEELAITVWDTSAEEPVARGADPRRVGGHGLHLVHAVSDRVVVAPHPTGKQVTAHLRLAPGHRPGAPAEPFSRSPAPRIAAGSVAP